MCCTKWTALGLLLLLSSFCSGALATGYARAEDCNDLSGLHLYLERLDGRPLEKTIVLKVPQFYLVEILTKDKQWAPAPAALCTAAGQCENAKSANVQFLKLQGRYVSGKFNLTLQDGKNLEGDFTVKLRKRKQVLICQ